MNQLTDRWSRPAVGHGATALRALACLVIGVSACSASCAGGRISDSRPGSEADGDWQPGLGNVIGDLAVVRVKGSDPRNIRGRLHFCVFDNGDHDYIYVGTTYGMWSNGEFDLAIDGKVVFTGHVPHLLYGGVVMPMGAVLDSKPRSRLEITRTAGVFK